MAEPGRRFVAVGPAAALLLTLGLAAGPKYARADMISDTNLLAKTMLVSGSQTNLWSFTAPGAGTLEIHLADLKWPDSLTSLTASIMSQGAVLGSFSLGSASDLRIGQGGTFAAYVMGQSGNLSGLNLGVYSLRVDFQPAAPVPLPSAIGLLLGSLGLLATARLLWSGKLTAPAQPAGDQPALAA